MPQYPYRLAYTPGSLAAMVREPQERLETAARPVLDAIGGRLLGGGYAFGERDVVLPFEPPDDGTCLPIHGESGRQPTPARGAHRTASNVVPQSNAVRSRIS